MRADPGELCKCGHPFRLHVEVHGAPCGECECLGFWVDRRPNCNQEGCKNKAHRQFAKFWNTRILTRESHGRFDGVSWPLELRKLEITSLCPKHALEFKRKILEEEKKPGITIKKYGEKSFYSIGLNEEGNK